MASGVKKNLVQRKTQWKLLISKVTYFDTFNFGEFMFKSLSYLLWTTNFPDLFIGVRFSIPFRWRRRIYRIGFVAHGLSQQFMQRTKSKDRFGGGQLALCDNIHYITKTDQSNSCFCQFCRQLQLLIIKWQWQFNECARIKQERNLLHAWSVFSKLQKSHLKNKAQN